MRLSHINAYHLLVAGHQQHTLQFLTEHTGFTSLQTLFHYTIYK